MDLAVAVITGGAFTGIVTALTANIINPLLPSSLVAVLARCLVWLSLARTLTSVPSLAPASTSLSSPLSSSAWLRRSTRLRRLAASLRARVVKRRNPSLWQLAPSAWKRSRKVLLVVRIALANLSSLLRLSSDVESRIIGKSQFKHLIQTFLKKSLTRIGFLVIYLLVATSVAKFPEAGD